MTATTSTRTISRRSLKRVDRRYTLMQVLTAMYRVLGVAQDRHRNRPDKKDKRWQRADDIIRDQISSLQRTGALCPPIE